MFTTLIIQDDATFRHLLKEGLCTRFPLMAVGEVGNSQEAFRVMESARPDLIFVDVRLKGESGFQLAKRIKSFDSDVPVVIITDHDLAEYREAAVRSGADHFIVKAAWNWDEITKLVKSLLVKIEPYGEMPEGKANECEIGKAITRISGCGQKEKQNVNIR